MAVPYFVRQPVRSTIVALVILRSQSPGEKRRRNH
jgi:hypothetical protein